MQIYLPVEEIIMELHDAIIDVSGGKKGVLKPGVINAAIHRPKTYLSYHENCNIHTVCGVLLDSIARNHAFADGNKRTCHAPNKIRTVFVKCPYNVTEQDTSCGVMFGYACIHARNILSSEANGFLCG